MDTTIVKTVDGVDLNCFGQPVIDCKFCCGRKTTMTGTRQCDFCYSDRRGQSIWVHVKTGGRYALLVEGQYEVDGQEMVAYQQLVPGGGTIWVRPKAEFYDGRFVKEGLANQQFEIDPLGELDETWKTLDGRVLKVSEMTDNHVRNAFNHMLYRMRRRREMREQLREMARVIGAQIDEEASWGVGADEQ